MPKEHILANEIIADHRERMLNLKKYYPFFKLSETSFGWFAEGKYEQLDMGYILMAVLRFFIEENNFKEKEVTYQDYFKFMTDLLRTDFLLQLSPEDNKILVGYIFDKLKNDGHPFEFTYYDPVDREKKISRIRLLVSRIKDSTVWYSISSEGIEFYLDTKEIRDESRISVEQLLLEKMIQSKDFKGGIEVVRRINKEVEYLHRKKNQVMDMLTADVFSGMEAYEDFFENGIRWFAEEQKLFMKNKELIEAARKRASGEKISPEDFLYGRMAGEIFRLDTELKIAMNNHSELLKSCTELGIMADEAVKKTKLSRLRTRFDFRNMLDRILKEDKPDKLALMVKPFFSLNIKKTFDLSKTEELLDYRPVLGDRAEKNTAEEGKDLVFEDELADIRFEGNVRTLMLILLRLLKRRERLTLSEYHREVSRILTSAIEDNGDYYAFLVHLCGKKEYTLTALDAACDTFLDELIKKYMELPEFAEFAGMHFVLELSDGDERELEFGEHATVTDFVIKRV